MKKTTILSISILGILLVLSSSPLLNTASAADLANIDVAPNPGHMYQSITITIAASTEGAVYDWRGCDLVIFFGDGSPSQNIGKLEPKPGNLWIKSTTHKYSKTGKYTIEVVPQSCGLSKSNMLKTTIQIFPPVMQKPEGRKRPPGR